MYFAVYLTIGLFGLLLGSYLNSWMWRAHEGVCQWGGRSICIHCNRLLAWYENIPVGSFLVLGGKCRTCRKPIPASYLWVELATALLFLLVTYHHLSIPNVEAWHFFRDLFFAALLIVVFMYDYLYFEILPGLMWLGALLAFGINIYFLPAVPGGGQMLALYSFLLGIAVGGGFFLLQYVVSKGKWIGQGDIHLGVLMGALLGWPNILVALFFSYVLGAIVAVPLLLMKKKGMNSEIPFGTFLAVGAFVAMLWGGQVVNWYTSIAGL